MNLSSQEAVSKPPGTGSFCAVRGAKCACPPSEEVLKLLQIKLTTFVISLLACCSAAYTCLAQSTLNLVARSLEVSPNDSQAFSVQFAR